MRGFSASLTRVRHAAWALAAVGAGGSATALFLDQRAFSFGYLIGFAFCFNVALGLLAVFMLQNVVRSSWGVRVRPWLEAAASVFPLFTVFFVPILLSLHTLYPWSRAELVATDPLLQHKFAYLNVPGFVLRAVLYFCGWFLLARQLVRWTPRDGSLEARSAAPRRVRLLSGLGLIFFVLSSSFAAIDWIRSLEPHWVSSSFGLYFVTGQQVSGFAVTAVLFTWLRRFPDWTARANLSLMHDLGKLLFASVTLWAYIAFTQYLIIWSGSIPEETEFFTERLAHGFDRLALALILLHFVLPFLLLMPRRLNERPALLGALGAWLLVMRFVDLYWLVAPSAAPRSLSPWAAVAPALALGGTWTALALGALDRRVHAALAGPTSTLTEES